MVRKSDLFLSFFIYLKIILFCIISLQLPNVVTTHCANKHCFSFECGQSSSPKQEPDTHTHTHTTHKPTTTTKKTHQQFIWLWIFLFAWIFSGLVEGRKRVKVLSGWIYTLYLEGHSLTPCWESFLSRAREFLVLKTVGVWEKPNKQHLAFLLQFCEQILHELHLSDKEKVLCG